MRTNNPADDFEIAFAWPPLGAQARRQAERDEVSGFNVVGLKRRGFSRETIAELKSCFAVVFGGGDPRKLAAARSAAGVQTAEARRFLEFCAGGKRGFIRPAARAVVDAGDET